MSSVIRWLKPTVPVIDPTLVEGDVGLIIYYPIPDENKVTLFTENAITHILYDIQLGLTLDDAAKRVGIKPTTVKSWYDSNYGNFYNAVEKAKVDNKALHLGRMVKADNMIHIKASAWLLERKHRAEYGKEVNMNLTPNIPEEKQIFKIGDKEIAF